jgi:integrase
MLADERPGEPAGVDLRRALHRYAFNTIRRASAPDDVRDVLDWTARYSLPARKLAEPEVLRRVLTTIARRIDGRPAAASVVSKRRRVLFNVAEFAVERGLLEVNPLPAMKGKWRPSKPSLAVDRRSVVNPVQARTLLRAVGETRRSGPRLVAFFGLMYFAAMRPEEAANVAKQNLALPPGGWGQIYLEEATPHAGSDWTDDGRARDRRQLKNRERGEGRTVPSPPELTALLHAHIAEFGTGPDGRLFVGERAEDLPKLTYMRTWRAARATTFTPDVLAGPLGATPYALRHACVSTWLNGGVPATQVAEWAGQSVEVLLRIYAKCLDGQDEALRRLVTRALGHPDP